MSAPAPSPAAVTSGALSAEDAIRSRRSIRAFLPTPVGDETVAAILELAARAPSGTNIQPWQVLVLRGEPLAALTRELHALSLAGDPGTEEFAYYPRQWREPYLSRRRKVGWDLYGTLGIAKGDTERMRRQLARNFLFFDAPVGLFVTVDSYLGRGNWADAGMYLQTIMLAAKALASAPFCSSAFGTKRPSTRTPDARPSSSIGLVTLHSCSGCSSFGGP